MSPVDSKVIPKVILYIYENELFIVITKTISSGWSMEESGDRPFFSCNNCRNPIALRVDLISKNYIAKSGQAYMFSHAMNVVLGSKVDRQMITGRFSVADVYCSKCKETLGWKYVKAYEQKQMYKEGNFILEKMKILKEY